MPEQYPWESWSPEARAYADKVIEALDAARQYRASPMFFPQGASHSATLASAGGLTPEQALLFARYKQFKDTTGGDPNWQGPMRINAGPRDEDPTPEQKELATEGFIASSKVGKQKMLDEAHDLNARSGERFFDSLIGPPRATPPAAAPAPPPAAAKREFPKTAAEAPRESKQQLARGILMSLLGK